MAGISKTADILLGGDFCPIRRFEKSILETERIFDDILVENCHYLRSCSQDEYVAYMTFLEDISTTITNDDIFAESWQKEVKVWWNRKKRDLFMSLPELISDPGNQHALKMAKNLINCPTHREFFISAIEMLQG